MSDLETRVQEILAAPCGCDIGVTKMRLGFPHAIRDCPVCLPKRIAAAIERAKCCRCSAPDPMDDTHILAALKGDA